MKPQKLIRTALFFCLTLLVILPICARTASASPISPTDDAFIVSKFNPSLNTGGFAYLETFTTFTSGYVASFLKFDLSSFAEIESATLWLYAYQMPATASTINAYMVANTWSEATLKGSNAPYWFGTTPVGLLVTGTGWKSWDVTSFAAAAAGGSLSLALSSTSTAGQFFYSKESTQIALRPYLELVPREADQGDTPEPGTMLLLGSAGGLMAAWRRRRAA